MLVPYCDDYIWCGIRLNKGELHQFVEKKLVSSLWMGGIRVSKGE